MTLENCISPTLDFRAICLTVLLAALPMVWKKFQKKKLSPIALIAVSAVAGVVVYGFL